MPQTQQPDKLKGYIAIINQVGFPIAVACYLLYDKVTLQREHTEILSELKILIETLVNHQ